MIAKVCDICGKVETPERRDFHTFTHEWACFKRVKDFHMEKLEKEHPYKVIGQPDTYSQYNEAWQDCMDRVLDIVKRGGVK